MTTRVTCIDPDGGHILGQPVGHDETVEVDDEIASVLDPEHWKIGRTSKPKTITDEDKETGQ